MPNLDWTPKQDFLKGPLAKKWANVAESDLFRHAMNTALLQTMADLPRTHDLNSAAANEWRRQGATMALFRLMNLHMPFDEPKDKDVKGQNLDHKV